MSADPCSPSKCPLVEFLGAKRCSKCQTIKPLDGFGKEPRSADGHKYACKDCQNKAHRERRRDPEYRAKEAAYREANRDRAIALAAEYRVRPEVQARAVSYRAENREKDRARSQRHYLANRDSILAAQRKRRKSSESGPRIRANDRARHSGKIADPEKREKLRDRSRTYYESNRERFAEYARARRARDPKGCYEITRRRRARKRNATVEPFTVRELSAHFDELNLFACMFCGGEFGSETELEHLVPLAVGGRHSIANAGLACRSCNARKHTKTREEFGISPEELVELKRAARERNRASLA